MVDDQPAGGTKPGQNVGQPAVVRTNRRGQVLKGPGQHEAVRRNSGVERQELRRLRGEFGGVRRDFWKNWAKNVERERQAGPKAGPVRDFDIFPDTVNIRVRQKLGGQWTTRVEAQSNLDRMRRGLAPYGSDGKPVNLHHMSRLSTSGDNRFENLVPVQQRIHQLWSKRLHSAQADRAGRAMTQPVKPVGPKPSGPKRPRL